MAKFNKSITVNLGNYQTVKLEVIESESFEQCDTAFAAEIKRLGIVNFQHQGMKVTGA